MVVVPNLIASATAQAKGNSKMLQVADVCAGALNNALEPNKYGQIEDSYVLTLGPKLRREGMKLWGYGLKVFPRSHRNCMSRQAEYGWMAQL